MRIGDADRAAAAQRLQSGLTEGRLTQTEYDERASLVAEARTEADLDPLLADLPPVVAAGSYDLYPHQVLAVPADEPDPRPTPTEAARPSGSPVADYLQRVPRWVWIVIVANFIAVVVASGAGQTGIWWPWWLIFFIPAVMRRIRRNRNRDS